jgi:hypothetical protein
LDGCLLGTHGRPLAIRADVFPAGFDPGQTRLKVSPALIDFVLVCSSLITRQPPRSRHVFLEAGSWKLLPRSTRRGKLRTPKTETQTWHHRFECSKLSLESCRNQQESHRRFKKLEQNLAFTHFRVIKQNSAAFFCFRCRFFVRRNLRVNARTTDLAPDVLHTKKKERLG